MKQIIEIKGECELIQIDFFQLSEDKQRWKSDETISCNIYFQKKNVSLHQKILLLVIMH